MRQYHVRQVDNILINIKFYNLKSWLDKLIIRLAMRLGETTITYKEEWVDK